MRSTSGKMRKLAALLAVVLVAGLVCGVLPAGCGKLGGHSRTSLTINGQTTITEHTNGVTRKLNAPCSFTIQGGRITMLAKGGVIEVQETGSPDARDAELREKEGAAELWIKEQGAYRKGTPADDAWLERCLQALSGDSSIAVDGQAVTRSRAAKAPSPEEDVQNVPVPAALENLKQRSFSHEREKGIKALIDERTLEPPDQVAVVEAVFDQLSFGHEKVRLLKRLIRKPGFSPEGRKAVIRRIDRLSMDSEKVEVQKLLLESE